MNISDSDPCSVCSDLSRDKAQIMVVEQPLDILAFERTGKYRGLYHVLHGAISPLENIGPDEIYIDQLFKRLELGGINEIIVATNPTMEGEATALYLSKKIKEDFTNGKSVSVSRLGMGIPTGADLEYADEMTLTQALNGRREL